MQDNPISLEGTDQQLFLVTKLAIPAVRSDLVARPRLMHQLQCGIQRPFTLIAAPAGFGKTTVLSSWLEHAPFSAAWVSLERDDDDLIRFWSYVFTALQRVYPGSGESALALLQGSSPRHLPPIETVLTVWINDLAALPRELLVLILDDYHLISAAPIHQSLAYLVDHLPSRLHLIMATQADPPLPLARLRMRGHLTEIRAADLRFTALETTAFLTCTLGQHLPDEDVAALQARTEGWIAGLQLAVLSLQGRTDVAAFLKAFTGSQRYIIDYLIEEVLARQLESVQTFLLQTAILERLQGSLCEAVIGKPGMQASGQAMLEVVEQANLFLTPLDDERQWYRYHQLFAQALRHRLQRKDPTLVPELHRRASGWYEQHSLMHDAVHHALAIPDCALAARLIEQAFNALVRRGEIATLQQWVAALPGELVRCNIELAILQGWLLFISGKHDEALLHLQDLEQTSGLAHLSTEHPEPPTLPAGSPGQTAISGRIAAIRAAIALARRDLARTITLSQLALSSLPQESMARSYVAGYLGKAHYFAGDIKAASIALQEAWRVSWEVNHTFGLFLVVHDLAHLHILQGHLYRADQIYRQALEQALQRSGSQPAMGPAYVGRGNLEREWNHLDAATDLLQKGITLCKQTGNTQAILQAYIGLAFIHQAQGDADGARALMQQAMQIQEQHALSRGTQVPAAQAWLFLMQGNEAAALDWIQGCGLSVDQDLDHLREREYLTLVRILLSQHRLDEAAKWLTNLLQLAEAQGRRGSGIEIRMLQAEALHAAGAINQAMEHLSRALSLAEPEGYIRLFVDEGELLARLLMQMRHSSSGPARYRDQLLALPGKTHEEHPSSSDAVNVLSEPLSEREREVLRLIVAGCSNREIANRLVIALSTVKWYVHAIYGKLQVESRTKAIARARELMLV
jgi:LuxR family maltose regulon positive regulatory protein